MCKKNSEHEKDMSEIIKVCDKGGHLCAKARDPSQITDSWRSLKWCQCDKGTKADPCIKHV